MATLDHDILQSFYNEPILSSSLFFKWDILGLFFLYFWNFSNKQCKFFSKLMWKNSHPVIFVILLEKDENKQKEAGFDPYIINTFQYVLVSMQVSDTNA